MDQEEFKFPDEVNEKPGTQTNDELEIEIEIEDDTPPEDRGRQPMPKEIVEELEKDELDSYDESVKIKLKQLKKVWNDERREKEAALREQNEAVRFAQRAMDENKKLRSMISTGEQEYVSSIQTTASLELEMAKRAYKEAYEMGDTDKIIDAQQAMQEANIRLMRAKNFKVPPLQEPETPVQTRYEQQPSVPEPDPKAQAWQKRNPWFGQDKEMSASVLGLHEKLKELGTVQIGSDEYYAMLDKTIRKRFPENFEADVSPQSTQDQKPAERAKPSTVVAPALRSTASNKIKLRTSQLNIAKRLGLTPEQYAIEQRKLEAQNG
jgi:hypothetical protein